jgi:asparagine synthase (glutamine-hydrolysing)
MCGIFGIVYRNGETLPSQRLLQKSAEALVHRGPDGSGIYHEPGIGLAHTRLSLLDLDARSNQPFWDAEGRHCLVYNGEIYNFREIREDLIRRGAAFRTTSDTEVLLTSLVMDGPETTLRRLRGMFAFAFYDRAKRRLTLARDRYGIKPLFIHRHREFLLFSSEVKAMRPWVQLAGNPLYLIAGLIGSTEATRHACIFEDTEILPPGTMLSIDSAGREESRHVLDLADMIDPEAARGLGAMSDRQSVDRLDELMNESVRSMMLADAPVGALCSGGVDSALLTAIATRYHSNIAIFHADVKGHSEYDAARAVAKHLKLDLQKVEAEEQHFIDLSPKAILHYEWPYVYHPHSIPFMMVADLARRSGVKAVLTERARTSASWATRISSSGLSGRSWRGLAAGCADRSAASPSSGRRSGRWTSAARWCAAR